MLDAATELVTDNKGMPLAPRRAFADTEDEGCLVVTTDASGVDGVGGYCFRREPGDATATAWLVSEAWPPDVRDALRRGAATPTERVRERREAPRGVTIPVLSMPAAELFGAWAVAEAVGAEARGRPSDGGHSGG
eukprot:6175008-Pleurochrysis_carterae.AAC.2